MIVRERQPMTQTHTMTTKKLPAGSHRAFSILAAIAVILGALAALCIVVVLAPWLFHLGGTHLSAPAHVSEAISGSTYLLGGVLLVLTAILLLLLLKLIGAGCGCAERRKAMQR